MTTEEFECTLGRARHFVETNPDEAIAYLVGHGVAALQGGELRIVGILLRNAPSVGFTIASHRELWAWFNESCMVIHTRDICAVAHGKPGYGVGVYWNLDDDLD